MANVRLTGESIRAGEKNNVNILICRFFFLRQLEQNNSSSKFFNQTLKFLEIDYPVYEMFHIDIYIYNTTSHRGIAELLTRAIRAGIGAWD